jgi:hypothetical protein
VELGGSKKGCIHPFLTPPHGAIFDDIKNKFEDGYSLRNALEYVDELQFKSKKNKHELSYLYETKIKNMGNAGRNGGKYYTPASADSCHGSGDQAYD